MKLWWDDKSMRACDLLDFYPLTVEGCKLRKLAVDCFVDKGHTRGCWGRLELGCYDLPCNRHPGVGAMCAQRDWLVENKDRLPFDFVLEVAKASIALEHKKRVEPGDRGRCYYHQHNEEVPECK